MATLKVTITAPLPNTVVNRSIPITGTVSIEKTSTEVASISGVSIQFDENPPFSATRVGTSWENWKATKVSPTGVIGGSTFKITATAVGQARPTGHTDEPWEPIEGKGSVTVRLEATPPLLTIDPYTPEVTPASLPYRLTLAGSARDEGSAVREVRWRLGSASFAPADNIQGNWLRWQKVIDLPAGEHLITIEAVDTLGNKSYAESPISVRTQFRPSNAELAFAPVTYLQELMSFAERWIKVGAGAGPKAQDLADRFFQPFDRLTQPDLYERAVRSLHQTRIAIEVLRGRLRQMNQPVPAAVGRSFRRTAYEALVLQLGASHEELRAARIADEATRRALAERLGFGPESARPDRLDQITLMPDQVTEAQLEHLFGFDGTMQDDPLHPVNAPAEVLNWRLAATRNRWLLEDAQARDGVADPIPIIDPDLVGEVNLLTRTVGNRVYDLWKARKTWLDAKLTEVENQRGQGFEHVIRTFIGSLDFPALTTQDANGEDISPVLDPLKLDLAAF